MLSGGENLSKPSPAELDAIPGERRKLGHRLACQATLTGRGETRVISLAELFRRETLEVLSVRESPDRRESLSSLVDDVSGFAFNFAKNLPLVVTRVVPRLLETPPSVSSVVDSLRDAGRMIERIFWRSS